MSGYSAYIVDDNEADRYLLRRDLLSVDMFSEIFEADNAVTALEFLNEFEKNQANYPTTYPPTIIFLDINMPLLDGFEFLDEFKKIVDSDSRYQSIVIMMFSSSEHEDDINKAMGYEFVKDYCIKGSFDKTSLKQKLAGRHLKVS